MTSQVEALNALIATARGERPQSLASREAEEVLNVTLAVLVELAVANDRIDRLERVVAELGGRSVEALRDIRYDGEIAQERQAATDALLTRALRIMLDPRAQK
jgi:protein gp37